MMRTCALGHHSNNCELSRCDCKCHKTIAEPRIPDFIETLEKMREIHLKKNEDYAIIGNPFANFDFTEDVLTIFSNNRDKTFVWPIACKLARLANLLDSDKPPNNESIEDSFIDIAVYVLLWKADYVARVKAAEHRKQWLDPGSIHIPPV